MRDKRNKKKDVFDDDFLRTDQTFRRRLIPKKISF